MFSPDSKYILTYDLKGLYILWEIKSGKEVQRFKVGSFPHTSRDKGLDIPFYSRPSLSKDNKYCLTEEAIEIRSPYGMSPVVNR